MTGHRLWQVGIYLFTNPAVFFNIWHLSLGLLSLKKQLWCFQCQKAYTPPPVWVLFVVNLSWDGFWMPSTFFHRSLFLENFHWISGAQSCSLKLGYIWQISTIQYLDFFVVENLDTLISASNLILNRSISFPNQTSWEKNLPCRFQN